MIRTVLSSVLAITIPFASGAFAQSISPPLPPVFIMDGATPQEEITRQYVTQLNLPHNVYWYNNNMLINRIHMLDEVKANAWSANELGEEYLEANEYIDANLNGGTFYRMAPASAGSSETGNYWLGMVQFDQSNPPAQEFVLTWDGDPNATFSVGGSQINERTDNRIEFTSYANASVYLTLDGFSGTVSNIQVYLAEQESLVAQGEIFTEEFLTEATKYDVLRHMDTLNINSFRGRLASQYGTELDKISQSRFSMETIFELSRQAENAAWINVPPMLGAVGAQASNYDQWTQLGVDNASRILESSEWRTFTDAIVAAMESQGYPEDRPVYIELGNEVWNYAYPFGETTNYFRGVAQQLLGEDWQHRYGYGYVSAMLANHFRDSLLSAGRDNQEWFVVLGSFMSLPSATTEAFQGVNDYISNVSSAVPVSQFGVTITGYYSGGMGYGHAEHNVGGSYSSESEWLAAFTDMAVTNPDQLSANIRDFYLSSTPYEDNLQHVFNMTDEHQRIAEAQGSVFLGQYEGGSHDAFYNGVHDHLINNETFMTFRNQWLRSEYHAAVVRRHNETFRSRYPNAMVSNFGAKENMTASSNHGPWSEQMDYDDITPVTEVWEETLAEANSGSSSNTSGSGSSGSSDSGSTDSGSGSTDSGSTDSGSGSTDSGSTDSGSGSTDSGSTDSGSGSTDSGSTDSGSGSTDSGSTDSGSGSTDSGSTDSGSGSTDSGSTDSGSGSSSGGEDSAEGLNEISYFVFGHSLYTWDAQLEPGSTAQSSTGYWLGALSQDNGKQSGGVGQFGQLSYHALPPIDNYRYSTDSFDPWPDGVGSFSAQNFSHVIMMPSNFEQTSRTPSDYLGDASRIANFVSSNSPDSELIIYEHWPEPPLSGRVADGANLTRSEWATYNAYTVGGYHDWFVEWQDLIAAAYPGLTVRMIPVGPIIAELFTSQSYLSDIEFGDLYADDAPHGSRTIYFLASLITYRAMYLENPDAGYTPPSGMVESAVVNNLPAIIDYIDSRLSVYNANGVRVY